MGASDLLTRLRNSGLTIEADGGALRVSPRFALTDQTRALIREHKAELLDVLGNASDPATQRRRTKAPAMLDADPNLCIAIVVDNPDTDPVRAMVGIKHVATGELEIPRHSYSPEILLELLQRDSLQPTLNSALPIEAGAS